MTDTKTRVQRNGQDTSWDAALLQTRERTAVLYRRIRAALHEPMTDEELEAYLRGQFPQMGLTPSGVRSRRNELVLTGWVTKARAEDGQVLKRQGSTGSPRIVWRAVREGEQVAIPTENGERVATDQVPAAAIDHEAGLAAAERYATWNLGDPSWVRHIIDAYLDPETAHRELDTDGAPR